MQSDRRFLGLPDVGFSLPEPHIQGSGFRLEIRGSPLALCRSVVEQAQASALCPS